MEREMMRTTEVVKGVRFVNFPRYRDPGEAEWNQKLLDGIVCEDIAEQIPRKLRGSVTVDFQALDYEGLLKETKEKHGIYRTMTDEQLAKAEKILINAIFGPEETESQRA